MDQDELLRRVVETLESLELPYLVTGSVATIFFGEPRFTNDIDVVVDLPLHRVAELCAAFPASEFYLSEEAARSAVLRYRQFNIIHPAAGLKVDVMAARPSAFNSSRFARVRRLRPAPDYEASFASPEDVILKKLEYFREGRSEKHLRDIAGVVRTMGQELDFDYVSKWAQELGVEEIWREVLERMGER